MLKVKIKIKIKIENTKFGLQIKYNSNGDTQNYRDNPKR